MEAYRIGYHADMEKSAAESFARAVELMAHLRGPEGCPWDREQTFDSIKPYTLEETYEVFDAIERRAWADLRGELGDLLLQVLFYAQMAQDEGHFSIGEVIEELNAKLVRRHPHVFGEEAAETAGEVVQTWDKVKQQEKAASGTTAEGLLHDIPRTMPALMEAAKIGSRAAKIGFDWSRPEELFDKLAEEEHELRAEIESPDPQQNLIAEEFGDLLFVAVNLARHLKVSPEDALRSANRKFRRRFAAMERFAGSTDALKEMPVSKMEELWAQAKQEEKA